MSTHQLPLLSEATARDAAALGELLYRCNDTYRAWAPAGWRPPPAERERHSWEQRFADGGHWTRIVRAPAPAIVGVVAWTQMRSGDAGRPPLSYGAHVSSLFVDPSRWRRGIASQLLSAAEAEMARRGFERAELWTPERAEARRFYEARGWQHDGRRQWFADLALPLVAYARDLTAP